MGRARGRTWTLAALDRGLVYRLWFSPVFHRWEVQVIDELEGTIDMRAEGARNDWPAQRRDSGARRPFLLSDSDPVRWS